MDRFKQIFCESLECRILYSGEAAQASIPVEQVSATFVPNLYADFFGRVPDPGGLSFWNGQLAAGVAPSQVVAAFVNSTEHRTTQISGYYRLLLGREPDAGGLAYWMNTLAAGGKIEQVLTGLYGSQEFVGREGGTRQAVEAIYISVLSRDPDDTGVTFWTNQVAGGMTVADVAGSILQSQEESEARVEGIYEFYLLRSADPGGLAHWSGQLEAGGSFDTVIEAVAGSPEYFANTQSHELPSPPE